MVNQMGFTGMFILAAFAGLVIVAVAAVRDVWWWLRRKRNVK